MYWSAAVAEKSAARGSELPERSPRCERKSPTFTPPPVRIAKGSISPPASSWFRERGKRHRIDRFVVRELVVQQLEAQVEGETDVGRHRELESRPWMRAFARVLHLRAVR